MRVAAFQDSLVDEVTASGGAAEGAGGLPFQVRGSMQTMLCLRLLRPEDPAFFERLVEKIAHNPEFFRDAPVVLDVGPSSDVAADTLEEMVERLRQHRLVPVGVQNASDAWKAAAARASLAVFAQGAQTSAAVQTGTPAWSRPAERAAPAKKAERKSTVVISQPVRGGQQVLSEGDMIVTAAVSAGAEIAAAGHIHVYGRLRGRAFAGMEGDEKAMIFCDQLDAELVSIAGIHLVNEEIDPGLLGKRVRVVCDGERLQVQPSP